MEVVPTTSAVSDSIDDLSNEEEEEERQPPVGRVGQENLCGKRDNRIMFHQRNLPLREKYSPEST